jgi:hypothetical protein
VLIAGLVLSGGCIPEAKAVGGDVVTVGAKELYAAYYQDETAADALYKGRTLEVTGIVSLSRAIVMTDQYIIVLNSEVEPTSNSWGVQCVFNTPRDIRLYKAERKQIVTVKGRCDGLQQDVVLRDCQFISLLSPTPTEQADK